jgi:hypothetical protein
MPAVAPPRLDTDDQLEDDLQRKREERHKREREDRKEGPSPAAKRRMSLLKDTLVHHERWFMTEWSLVGATALTSGDKEGYTVDPTVHMNLFLRRDPSHADGRVGLWYGARVAPFAGTGFYKKKPGAYGSTYFGPMIGVGKIDPVPEDGVARADPASGEIEIPSADGWVLTTGVAAVSRLGHSDSADPQDKHNDFVDKGVVFDAPGLWAEARFLRILYGAAGFDLFLGVQTGDQKIFVYGGIGAAAWN